jgi:putative transcriptional regulator
MISSNLSAILGQKRLKISQVSRDTGISRNVLTKLYFDKQQGVHYGTLDKLCAYLKVTPGDLVTFISDLN